MVLCRYIDFRKAIVEGSRVKFVSVKMARSSSCPSERFDGYKGGQVPSDCIISVCAGICHEPLSVLSRTMQCPAHGQCWTEKPPPSSVYIPLSLSLFKLVSYYLCSRCYKHRSTKWPTDACIERILTSHRFDEPAELGLRTRLITAERRPLTVLRDRPEAAASSMTTSVGSTVVVDW